MSVEIREATSAQMEKNKKVVGRMTGGVMFGAGIENVNWKLVRVLCNFGYSFMPKEKGIKIQKLNLNGINAEMSIPDSMTSPHIIMYIHGGGLVSGSAKATRGYCSMLAKYSGCRVVSIDYRLAPENTYPAAVNDCFAAYTALAKQYPDSGIALTGESGGAYLCLALTVRLIETESKLPACLVPHSPLCDLSGSLDRSYYDIIDGTVTPEAAEPIRRMYAPNSDSKHPEVSPLFYEQLEKFPPVTMTCDFNETLRADADAMCQKLKACGVDVHLIILRNTFHACSTLGTGSPETMQLMLDNIAFIKQCSESEQYEYAWHGRFDHARRRLFPLYRARALTLIPCIPHNNQHSPSP